MSVEALPKDMLAIKIGKPGGPDALGLAEIAVPTPGEGEILVKVEAAGVNRPDIIQRQGNYTLAPGVNPIPGLEIAGEVVRVGKNVDGFSIGDRVCALTNGGGYAQYCVVPAGQTLPIPSGLSSVQAAAIPETFFTVWANLFQIGNATKGETALIHGGTSGIGTTALMLCGEFGISAIGTAGSDDKCEAMRRLGAKAINYRNGDFTDAVLEMTGTRGVDIVLDIMGASYLDSNINVLTQKGRLILVGFLGGYLAEKVDLRTIARKQLTISGSTMRPRTNAEKAAIADDLRTHVWPALSAGRCLPLIDSVFPLAQVADAHRKMEESHHIGKIVLSVGH